ncbi:MAG: PQQ-binding-like beta-propeller repeat protein [Verrucomicrobiota bacterium]
MKIQCVFILLALMCELTAATPQWPQFRGPNGSGVAEEARPPVRFGPSTNQLWKTPIPFGVSAPVVWGNRIFLSAHASNQLVTIAFDAESGRELWRRVAPAKNIERCHNFSSPAASTPCTDGQRVYSYFGSFGLIAYNFQGEELWQRPFERLPSSYGTATSPMLAGGKLILQRDGDSTNAQVIALEPATGKTIWEAARPLAGASYSTPMVWRHDGIEELLIQGKGRLAAYDLNRGELKWWVKGWGFAAVTTPVAGDGMLFAGGSGMGDPAEPEDPILNWNNLIKNHDANQDGILALDEIPESVGWHIRKEVPKETPGNYFPVRNLMSWFVDADKNKEITKAEWDELQAFSKDKYNADRFVAIRAGGKDDSTETHVEWETTRGLSEMPSPLFYRGRVHFIRDGGLWTVLDPRKGTRLVDRERLPSRGQSVASPVAANGHIYVVDESGTFTVLRAGDGVDVVHVARLGENVRATPAIAGDCLYVRTSEHLWAFRGK